MTTVTDISGTVQDGIMKVVETGQRLTLEAMGAFVSTVDGLVPERPKMPFASAVFTPKEALDTSFAFAERIMKSQKAFLSEIVGLVEPATPAKKTA